MERHVTGNRINTPEETAEVAAADAIVGVLYQYGVDTLPVHALQATPRESWQRIVVWHAKEVGLNPEEVGRACFGDEWQENTWI